jgi:hypothetical protein
MLTVPWPLQSGGGGTKQGACSKARPMLPLTAAAAAVKVKFENLVNSMMLVVPARLDNMLLKLL